MTLDDLRQDKRAAIVSIASKHGVTGIRVFGSFARGEARPDSDLDLLIETGPTRTPFFPGGLIADLEAELGRRIEVTTRAALHPLMREEILREAVVL
jgi:predicted nucleotidyltransferase